MKFEIIKMEQNKQSKKQRKKKTQNNLPSNQGNSYGMRMDNGHIGLNHHHSDKQNKCGHSHGDVHCSSSY